MHAVSVLALWCNRFTTEVPKKLTEWFKKAFSLKTSTSAVRHAYLQCMLACFRGEMLPLPAAGGPAFRASLLSQAFPFVQLMFVSFLPESLGAPAQSS